MKKQRKEKEPFLVWDECATDEEIKDYQESQNDMGNVKTCKHCGHVRNEPMTFEEARDEIYQDQDYWYWRWQDFLECLQSELLGKNTYFKDEATGIGWRGLTGYKVFEAEDAKGFIQAITPRTSEFSLRIWKHGRKGMKIRISHHDAPMGESHLIKPISEKEFIKLNEE